MPKLMPPRALHHHVSHLEGVQESVYKEAKEVGTRAKARLASVRASSTHLRDEFGESEPYDIDVHRSEPDSLVSLDGPNSMALEFGHAPSGVFGPGGSMGDKHSRSPHGQHILTDAAGLDRLEFTPAPTGRRK